MAIAKKSGKLVSTRLIARHAHEIGISEYMRHPIEAMKILRALVWKKYKMAKPTARNKGLDFLQRRTKMQEAKGNDNLTKKTGNR